MLIPIEDGMIDAWRNEIDLYTPTARGETLNEETGEPVTTLLNTSKLRDMGLRVESCRIAAGRPVLITYETGEELIACGLSLIDDSPTRTAFADFLAAEFGSDREAAEEAISHFQVGLDEEALDRDTLAAACQTP